MPGKPPIGKQGGFAAQGVAPVVFVPSSSPGIITVLIYCTAVFQVGNGAQVVAEDMVHHPAARAGFLGNGNGSVGVAAYLPPL